MIMTETEIKPVLKIETLDDMKRILTIAKGGDPDAQQAIIDFMDLKSNIERSYFPDKVTTLCVSQLTGFHKLFYPDDSWCPFDLAAQVVSTGFMGFKGFKSNQFVDMTRTQADLSGLQITPEEQRRGLIDTVLKRRNTE